MSEDISPKVRKLVWYLNHQGYTTCDSGDGSNLANGMECALPYPHVVVQLERFSLAEIADIESDVGEIARKEYMTQVSFELRDREPCFVSINGLTDDDIELSLFQEHLYLVQTKHAPKDEDT